MPAQVSTTYTANYTDTEIGGGVEGALNAFNQATGGRLDKATDAFFATEEAFKEGVEKLILATLGTVAPGFKELEKVRLRKQEQSYQIEWNLHLKVSIKDSFNIHSR